MSNYRSENELLEPLICFLKQSKRISVNTIFSYEFYWSGRRVDLATLTASGRSTAYELKLSNNFRAVEQAAYNKFVFDRSYVVTALAPSPKALEFAKMCGVGIILISQSSVKICLNSSVLPGEKAVKQRLHSEIKEYGAEAYV